MAIPIIAIKQIERTHNSLPLRKTDKKGELIAQNTFEIHLKADFLDLYMRPDYEKLFAPDTKRRNYHLQQIQKEINQSPSKTDIK